ncbi:hypothetical protein A3844_21870 [Paenibacillus helianthi]|uniref:Uncharacterized protein n=1 Tax=Paenibacillus helianthi TaxID=1349432 RepID=A0ABX3EIL0_9BACL|nr:hypothetical protein A3844_21870 [Paenibacillus helianthi]
MGGAERPLAVTVWGGAERPLAVNGLGGAERPLAVTQVKCSQSVPAGGKRSPHIAAQEHNPSAHASHPGVQRAGALGVPLG